MKSITKSIKFKWMLAVVILLGLFIGAVILTNTFLLDEYYVFKTRAVFIDEMNAIRETAEKGSKKIESTPNRKDPNKKEPNQKDQNIMISGNIGNELYEYLLQRNSQTGYKYSIINDEFEMLFISSPEFEVGKSTSVPRNERDYLQEYKEELDSGKLLYTTIGRGNDDHQFVQLTGNLGDGEYVMITQPLGQVVESAAIANDFLLIVGTVFLGLSIILAYFLSKRMVQPVLEITDITKSIANMDFSKRYTGESEDEVGVLGDNINLISEKLDMTIGALKDTNEQLIREMKLQKRFIASVSHEFKTPVGLIRGYCEALQLGMVKTEESRNEVTDILIKESDRLSGLVRDIVMLMHMDSGTFQVQKREFDLVQMICETINKFKLHIDEKNVVVVPDMPETLIISADEMRLAQVVENYISNAIRHVDENGKLTVRIFSNDKKIQVEVENSGSPISKAHIEHLFDPFYRAEDARSRQSGGSGLGLSIVKGIVTSHGGHCGAKNTADGACFWIEI